MQSAFYRLLPSKTSSRKAKLKIDLDNVRFIVLAWFSPSVFLKNLTELPEEQQNCSLLSPSSGDQ